jgi:3-methyladenine DNA glycosylase Tag
VTDERGLFERTTLEAFQSGMSWLTSSASGTRRGTLLL